MGKDAEKVEHGWHLLAEQRKEGQKGSVIRQRLAAITIDNGYTSIAISFIHHI
jgi:hypothetical protein